MSELSRLVYIKNHVTLGRRKVALKFLLVHKCLTFLTAFISANTNLLRRHGHPKNSDSSCPGIWYHSNNSFW